MPTIVGNAKVQPVVPWSQPDPIGNYNSIVTPALIDVDKAGDNKAYLTLKDKIDFKKTDAYRILDKYLAPMKGMALPETTKYSIAINQIKQNENIDAGQILAAFDGLHQKLSTEHSNFDNWKQGFIETNIKPFEAKENDLNNEISDLQRQIDTKVEELKTLRMSNVEAKNKLDRATAQFEQASQLIDSEIERDRTSMSSLLQS